MFNRHLLISLPLTLMLAACASTQSQPDRERSLLAAETNTKLGIRYLQNGDLEKARSRLEKAIEQAPDYAVAHDAIAVLYDQVGETSKAEKHYRESVRLDPKNGNALNNYGQFLCKAKRFSEAEDTFRRAIENPFYRSPWVPQTNAGICMMQVPDYASAEAYLRQALTAQPLYAPALLNMGELSFTTGKYLNARAYLQRYQQVTQHTPETLWLGVRTEYALKDHAAWGKYALQLKNDFPDSAQYLLLQEWENERRSGN
jgi:type IV pilus assembly protein PilF